MPFTDSTQILVVVLQ